MAGFDVQVDDNGDVEFNMTLLEFVKNESGCGKKAVFVFPVSDWN